MGFVFINLSRGVEQAEADRKRDRANNKMIYVNSSKIMSRTFCPRRGGKKKTEIGSAEEERAGDE
jgi:hypothetical protein